MQACRSRPCWQRRSGLRGTESHPLIGKRQKRPNQPEYLCLELTKLKNILLVEVRIVERGHRNVILHL